MFYTYRILDSFAHWGEHKEKKKVLSHASSPSFFHEFFRNYTVASKANYSAPHFGRTPFVKNFPVLSQHAAATGTAYCCWLQSWSTGWLAAGWLLVHSFISPLCQKNTKCYLHIQLFFRNNTHLDSIKCSWCNCESLCSLLFCLPKVNTISYKNITTWLNSITCLQGNQPILIYG